MNPSSLVWVGIDVGSTDLVVHHRPAARQLTVPNTAAGVRQLVTTLRQLAPAKIVAEATGGYERRLMVACRDAALPLVIVNPRLARRFAESLGRLEKTDAVDAADLALYAERQQPPCRPLPDAATLALQDLVTRRRQLVDMRTAEQHRRRQAAPIVRPDLTAHLRQLDARIARIDRQLQAAITAHPTWAATAALLDTAKGAGPVLITTLLALVPELETLTRRQIAKLIGVAPLARDSGKRRGRRHCWGGRSAVRAVLYMCMGSAIQHNPTIRVFYQRLIAQGKPEKVARVACLRKFLVRLNAMVRDGHPWQ
ncbi:MAG: IS110 family transposase [Armatimonadota bacterium]